MTFSDMSRQCIQAHVDVLVEERIGAADCLFLVQRMDGMFAVVRFGYQARTLPSDFGGGPLDLGKVDAGETLYRVRWFRRDEIADALVASNIRPLPPSGQLLSFYGACAVSLGIVEMEGKGEVERLRKRLYEAKLLIANLLPDKRTIGTARSFAHQLSDLHADR